MKIIFGLILVAALPLITEGRSDGAPQCVKIPGHGVKSKSKEDFDKMYSVSITKSADSDNRWVVKVAGKNGNKFKGFLIRPSWSNQGILSGGSNGLYRTITDGCEGIDGVTHRDPDEKSEVSVEFTPDESDLKMLNMTLVLARTRSEVWEERTFTGFAADDESGADRSSTSTTTTTTDRFNSNAETTERNGPRTSTDRFGESTERNGQWGSGNNGQRTTDRFGNFETTERGQDPWNNNGQQRTTDRFGNFETTERGQDSWNNNGQRTTEHWGNSNEHEDNWNNNNHNNNNGQRTTDRWGNFETTQRNNGQDSWNNNNGAQRTTDRFGRTSTTDRYGDEYSDDHDNDNDHHDDRDHFNNNNNNNNNNNGWPTQDDRERNPIAGLRTTTASTTTSRFTNRVPIPRDSAQGSSAPSSMSAAIGGLLLAIQLTVYIIAK